MTHLAVLVELGFYFLVFYYFYPATVMHRYVIYTTLIHCTFTYVPIILIRILVLLIETFEFRR